MKYIYILFFILCSLTVLGAPVTPEAALTRLCRQNFSRGQCQVKTHRYRISEIMTDSYGNNTVYIFDSEDGFVVAPADDALPAVLGYGDGEMYDAAGNLPIGFCEWLQYISGRISDIAARGKQLPIARRWVRRLFLSARQSGDKEIHSIWSVLNMTGKNAFQDVWLRQWLKL